MLSSLTFNVHGTYQDLLGALMSWDVSSYRWVVPPTNPPQVLPQGWTLTSWGWILTNWGRILQSLGWFLLSLGWFLTSFGVVPIEFFGYPKWCFWAILSLF